MRPTLAAIRPFLSAVFASFLVMPAISHSATYSTELDFAVTVGPWGEYLTASYDFGIPFREVQWMTLELDMPEGYQGTAVSTGNSSLFRHLLMQIHASSNPPPIDDFSQVLGSSASHISAGSPAEFSIYRLVMSADGASTYLDWPAFLLSGSGNVSLMEAVTSSFHPWPLGEGGWSSTTSWLPPTGIAAARLTIQASPVPEPSAGMLVLVAVAICRRFRRGSSR
jgi:hypothetical protein